MAEEGRGAEVFLVSLSACKRLHPCYSILSPECRTSPRGRTTRHAALTEDGAEAVDQKRACGGGGRRDFAWGSRRGAHLKQASWVDAPPVPIPGPTELGLGMPSRPRERRGAAGPGRLRDSMNERRSITRSMGQFSCGLSQTNGTIAAFAPASWPLGHTLARPGAREQPGRHGRRRRRIGRGAAGRARLRC